MSNPDEVAWQVAGDQVRARRVELGLTQQEAAARADVGSSTWLLLERGRQQSFRSLTLAAVARALRWTPDSIDRILRGEDPVPLAEPPGGLAAKADLPDKLSRLSPGQRRAIETLVDEMLGEG